MHYLNFIYLTGWERYKYGAVNRYNIIAVFALYIFFNFCFF